MRKDRGSYIFPTAQRLKEMPLKDPGPWDDATIDSVYELQKIWDLAATGR
jgi:hypothetical protein